MLLPEPSVLGKHCVTQMTFIYEGIRERNIS